MSTISSVSSTPPPAPVAPPQPAPQSNDSKRADLTTADDAGAAQPADKAPLPPGQGARIDQVA